MTNRSVLISGASVAGPALAFWLSRFGYDVTIVEKAPSLRDGGYAVDFRGTAMEVLRRMFTYPPRGRMPIMALYVFNPATDADRQKVKDLISRQQ